MSNEESNIAPPDKSKDIDKNIIEAFCKAVCQGDTALMETLIAQYPTIVNTKHHTQNSYPVDWAAENGQLDTLIMLKNKAAKLDTRYIGYFALRSGSLPIITYLQNINIMGRDNVTLLNIYVSLGDLDKLKTTMNDGDIDRVNQWKLTLLDQAILCKKKDIVSFLLDKGAKITQKSYNYASKSEDKELVKLFLNKAYPAILMLAKAPEVIKSAKGFLTEMDTDISKLELSSAKIVSRFKIQLKILLGNLNLEITALNTHIRKSKTTASKSPSPLQEVNDIEEYSNKAIEDLIQTVDNINISNKLKKEETFSFCDKLTEYEDSYSQYKQSFDSYKDNVETILKKYETIFAHSEKKEELLTLLEKLENNINALNDKIIKAKATNIENYPNDTVKTLIEKTKELCISDKLTDSESCSLDKKLKEFEREYGELNKDFLVKKSSIEIKLEQHEAVEENIKKSQQTTYKAHKKPPGKKTGKNRANTNKSNRKSPQKIEIQQGEKSKNTTPIQAITENKLQQHNDSSPNYSLTAKVFLTEPEHVYTVQASKSAKTSPRQNQQDSDRVTPNQEPIQLVLKKHESFLSGYEKHELAPSLESNSSNAPNTLENIWRSSAVHFIVETIHALLQIFKLNGTLESNLETDIYRASAVLYYDYMFELSISDIKKAQALAKNHFRSIMQKCNHNENLEANDLRDIVKTFQKNNLMVFSETRSLDALPVSTTSLQPQYYVKKILELLKVFKHIAATFVETDSYHLHTNTYSFNALQGLIVNINSLYEEKIKQVTIPPQIKNLFKHEEVKLSEISDIITHKVEDKEDNKEKVYSYVKHMSANLEKTISTLTKWEENLSSPISVAPHTAMHASPRSYQQQVPASTVNMQFSLKN